MTEATREIHDLGLCGAARAIRNGDVSSETYVGVLLERAGEHSALNAFITVPEASVLEAARDADRKRRNGHAGPLLGVPVAVKDSYLTAGVRTTLGTAALSTFAPTRDAALVTTIKEMGGIIIGKNNMVEMSYGLTGWNEHYGQARNPHDTGHITGGSSSGAGAAVAARIVPAAFGGDTVGSIRVPASLCGVVGYKPTPGRWSCDGVAPIAPTLDTCGLLARNVEDCDLIDALVTRNPDRGAHGVGDLRGRRLAFAPRQHWADGDEHVVAGCRRVLRELAQAGATLVEVDLGEDFHDLAARATWPIFLHETLPSVRGFLTANQVPASVEQIHAGLGEPVRKSWSRAVMPGGQGSISDEAYRSARHGHREELRGRFASCVFRRADALLLPTTPCAAPRIRDQWRFRVGSTEVNDLFLSRNTHPSSAAGLPGITLPVGLTSEGLPFGLEINAPVGLDRHLLGVALGVERVVGRPAGPKGL